MKQTQSTLWKIFSIGLIIGSTGALLFSASGKADHEKAHALKSRASKIFAYDQNVRKLPFNQLAALSVAIEFEDTQGAEILVYSLEHQMYMAQR